MTFSEMVRIVPSGKYLYRDLKYYQRAVEKYRSGREYALKEARNYQLRIDELIDNHAPAEKHVIKMFLTAQGYYSDGIDKPPRKYRNMSKADA